MSAPAYQAPASEASPSPLAQRLLPFGLLAPPLALVWPLPRLIADTDPLPHVAGTALVLLTALPLGLLLVMGGVRPRLGRAAWLALLPALILTLSTVGVLATSDTFERDRLLLLSACWLPASLGGAALSREGRRTYVRGLVVLCVVALAPSLIAFVADSDRGVLAGPLGNSGPTAQLALPGAIIGAWLGASRRGFLRVLGFTAFGLAVAHGLLAPVVTSLVALVAALLASSLLGAWPRQVRPLRTAFSAMAAAVLFLGIVSLSDRGPTADVVHATGSGWDSLSEAATESTSNKPRWSQFFGGLPVRFGVWNATAQLAIHSGLAGVGPGQFAASFPPYRQQAELDASRLERGSSALSEVDHAHNDWLQALCDFGPVGGASWLALAALVGLAALRALGRKEVVLAAAGAGTLGLWVAAAAHGPLLVHPGSSFIAATLSGLLLSASANPDLSKPSLRTGRSIGAWVGLLVLVVLVPRALGMHRHGLALAGVIQTLSERATPAPSPAALLGQLERQEAFLARGLAARPDSPLLLSLTARALVSPVRASVTLISRWICDSR